ncbi:MAG: hypothetical protein ACREAA_11110 [Candidatus Polarisedimenticolia bacterium]
MSHPPGRHETRDISLPAVVWTAVGFIALGALGMIVSGIFFAVEKPLHPMGAPRSMRHERPAAPLPPEPRLQVSPQTDMRAMRAQEQELLHSYGWVDRQAGRVRIPIERAMEIVAEKGAP